MKGFSWEAGDSITLDQVQTIAPYHVNWIAQTPFAWQAHVNDPNLSFRRGRGYWGERKGGLVHTAQLGKELGVKTLLKPHIWMRRDAGGWRSDIEMKTEEDWQIWFKNYGEFMLHYAQLAEEQQLEALCIGTELYLTAVQREADWRALIAEIRKVYSGKLTFAANFYKEYEEIQFWDALDYIGIQAYFPLCNSDNPSLEELKAGWAPHYKRIKKLSKKWGKPVIITELGYRSMKNAAIEPWEWPNRMDFSQDDISPETQALCYEAFFQTFWEERWLAGVFFWKWSRRNYNPDQYERRLARRKRRDISPIDFSPKSEGLEVIKEWFGER